MATDEMVVLRNDAAELQIAHAGGALASFTLRDAAVNPFAWAIAPDAMPKNNRAGAPFRGHFLCLGRWGAPTPGEQAVGIPHNGEASNLPWQVAAAAARNATMSVTGPREQWTVTRKVALAERDAVVTVEETFANLLPVGRFTAIVQHATVGGDFLTAETLVDTNAGAGFNQALVTKAMTDHEYRWPAGYADKNHAPIDLRRSDASAGYVSTHVVDGEWGWATVATPSRGILIGYVWKTSEYPWLHIWHGMRDGKPWAKGIELGTTGLGDTFPPAQSIAMTFHGRGNALFVDAKASVTKSYRCFLLKIPPTFRATRAVRCDGTAIELELDVGGALQRERLSAATP